MRYSVGIAREEMNEIMMIALLAVLTTVGFITLIAGFVWMIVSQGQTQTTSGVFSGASSARGRFFAGKGVHYERDAEISGAEINQDLNGGRILAVAPVFLTFVGLFAGTFFLSLILLMTVSNKLPGAVVLLFSLYSSFLFVKMVVRGERGQE